MRQRANTALFHAGYYRQWADNAGEPPILIAALVDYAAQNPGLDPRDYGYDPPYSSPDWRTCYMQDSRMITGQWQDVKTAVRECYLTDATDRNVIDAAPHAFSGRLEIDSSSKIEYTPGQYTPTEYRAAVAAVLHYAAVLAQRERVAA